MLERQNLQEAIVHSWRAFAKEVKIPDLQFIGKEVIAHDNVNDRIDILAFDPNDNIPVIIELKRDRNKFQLLQGLSYAAMISSWNAEKFIEVARKQPSYDLQEIENSLSDLVLENNIKIILISEKFDPEVIITAHWLHDQFGMDIICMAVSVFMEEEKIYLSFQQRYPLTGLDDSYDLRAYQRSRDYDKSEKTWEEVTATFTYEWGEELLRKCRKKKEGDPTRKRILGFRTNFDEFEQITIRFAIHYVGIYVKGRPENAVEFIQSKFRENIEVNEWRDGYSFRITTHCQYEDLCSWLGIESKET